MAVLCLVLAGFGSVAQAAPSCFSDTAGMNDVSGQSDVTRFCVDNDNMPASFDVYVQWDETGLNGNGQTPDGCTLFDTDGDASGNVDYAICLGATGNPPTLNSGPDIYSCSGGKNDRCTNPVSITPTGTTCSVSVQPDDPFAGGAAYPGDTVGFCTINTADIPAGGVRINYCSFNSGNPNSSPPDCAGAIGGGFINVVNVAAAGYFSSPVSKPDSCINYGLRTC